MDEAIFTLFGVPLKALLSTFEQSRNKHLVKGFEMVRNNQELVRLLKSINLNKPILFNSIDDIEACDHSCKHHTNCNHTSGYYHC